jgi:hypothetical protein
VCVCKDLLLMLMLMTPVLLCCWCCLQRCSSHDARHALITYHILMQ